MLSDVSQWTAHDGVTCIGVSEPPMLNIPLFKPHEVSETSATHIIYVSLAEKFKILPFIGSHERGVTCKGVSEPPMLNIHLSVQHLGEVAVLYQTFKYKLLFVDMSKVVTLYRRRIAGIAPSIQFQQN